MTHAASRLPAHPHRRHTRARRHALLGALLATALLAGCHGAPEAGAEAEPAAPTVSGNQIRFVPGHPQLKLLTTTPAAPGQAVPVELPARLVWNEERTQRLYAPFAGRVTAIKADLGQPVRPGTVLAQLASPDFGIAQADAAKAAADVSVARKNLERQRELFGAGVVARKDFEQAEADAARAQAETARAGARTAMYGARGGMNQLSLTSGIDGLVVERNLNPGQELRPDQSGAGIPALFVLSDPTSLWVQIDAREAEVGTLRPGAAFVLTVPGLPGRSFEGRVVAAADFIDPASRTIKVRGVVPNADRQLKAEMLATARFERSMGAGVVVPAGALMLRGTKHSVMVQTQPGTFEARDVQVGWSGPDQALVSKGLEVGEPVVSQNALLLARQLRLAQPVAPAQAQAQAPAQAAKP